MALKKLAKWEMALLAGVILIVPAIIAFQLTKTDIEIKINPTFAGGCSMEGDVCTYNMNNNIKTLKIVEDSLSWKITGTCIDTDIQAYYRLKAIAERDGLFIIQALPPNPDKCSNEVVFLKKDWNRENKIISQKVEIQCITFPCEPVEQDFELNIFKLKNVASEKDVRNFIEKVYGS